MKPDRIDELLEKFYEGNTTLEEEKFINEYINNSTQASVVDKAYFNTCSEIRNSESDSVIDKTEFNEKPKARKLILKPFIGIAASIAILATIFIQNHNYQQEKKAEEAFFKTYNALMKISQHLNNGERQLNRISTIDKSINKTVYISKLNHLNIIN